MNRVFISYSHEEQEWVEPFSRRLEQTLRRKFGNPLEVWLDCEQIRGSTQVDETIKRKLDETDVFLFMMSPSSQNSKYCRLERQLFIKAAQESSIGLKVGDDLRMFNVLLSRTPRKDWPKDLKNTPGLDFFVAGPQQGDKGEMLPLESDEFKGKISRLAEDVCHVLDQLPLRTDQLPDPADDRLAVYVARVPPNGSLKYMARKLIKLLVHVSKNSDFRKLQVRTGNRFDGLEDFYSEKVPEAWLSVHFFEDEEYAPALEDLELSDQRAVEDRILWLSDHVDFSREVDLSGQANGAYLRRLSAASVDQRTDTHRTPEWLAAKDAVFV